MAHLQNRSYSLGRICGHYHLYFVRHSSRTRIVKKRLVISMLLCYLILFLSKKMGLFFPELINSYATDMLCIPIVLSIARYGIAYWINDARFQLNRWHMAAATLAFVVTFELVLPTYSSTYTADPFDALMYVSGVLLFERFQTPSLASVGNFSRTAS